MMLTRDLKVKFLGITPVLKDKTGVLNPQEIVALSALLTFKGKSIKALLKDAVKKGENVEKKISTILQKSSLRGHASIATTPSLCLTYEGSKFLDSVLSGIIFSSSLMASGRRTKTTINDIVYPDKIFLNRKTREIYQNCAEKIINYYNSLLDKGVKKDEASKILQYGIYGTGIIQLPIESIVGIKREYALEKEWMPEEVGILLSKIEKNLKNLGVNLLYTTRETAPRNVYPYPNIFKNPIKSNLVRELQEKEKLIDGSRLISMNTLITPELKKKLTNLEKKSKEVFSSSKNIKKEWPDLIFLRQEILRDYNLSLKFRILSSIPWRIWGEKKRHRTVPQIIESIYYCIGRAAKIFIAFKSQIRNKKITKELVEKIEEVFSIPPSVKNNKEFLDEYLLVGLNSFENYYRLINLGVEPRDAIFLIPRAVKIDILQEYDLYNLLTGYYPLRLCQTAEEEMRRNTIREVQQIKKALTEKGYDWLNKFIVPKCQIMGFCPEEKSCGVINGLVKGYSEKFHSEMKEDLKQRAAENFKNLGK